jgi:outer membrane protein OmpA-like peptidoglycan-associated protein
VGILAMSDGSNEKLSPESPNYNHSVNHQDLDELRGLLGNEELDELRGLLLGIDPPQLHRLYARLENADVDAEDISRLLPEAVILRSMQDKQLSVGIMPTVEDAIQLSVRKDFSVLADSLFPIIGPATRKAISTALAEMNQTLEHSLSPNSFKWRLEARQTGKSFAEVVLLRTLLYRVEQIFLIHRETGLVLQHLVAPEVKAQDADLVSAMLTAIQDFVHDSFSVRKEEILDTLHFGDLTIWIEPGPQAILAGIIRGNAPQELRLVFQETIEKIHWKQKSELKHFRGNASVFKTSVPDLQVCLQAHYQNPFQDKRTNYVKLVLGTVAIAVGVWSFLTIRDQLRWNNYLETLEEQPGIVIIASKRQHGKRFISGMRDPVAVDPTSLMTQANINPQTVISHWEPYLSFDPKLTTTRVNRLLQPPSTVSLQVDEHYILHAKGSATRQWIEETRKFARFIPGVTQLQDQLTDKSELESAKDEVEHQSLFFIKNTTQLVPGQDDALQKLQTDIKKLLTAANGSKNAQIQIIGHATKEGTEQQNNVLRQGRAERIQAYLISQGINAANLSAVRSTGTGGSSLSQTSEIPTLSVSFKVLLSDTRN